MPPADEAIAQLNALRERGASCGDAGTFGRARPLRWNDGLADGAARLARRLAIGRWVTHLPDGWSLRERLQEEHYPYLHAAENIAAGPPTLDAALAGWMASTDHCANLMGTQLRDVGLACAASTGDGTAYWAVVLGARAGDDVATAANPPEAGPHRR